MSGRLEQGPQHVGLGHQVVLIFLTDGKGGDLTEAAHDAATGRIYPTLKYALGYGKICSKVTVAGENAPFERPRLLAA